MVFNRTIKYKKVKISDKNSSPNKNWILPTALVKEKFGDFQIKEKDGTWIITEPAWREKNIEDFLFEQKQPSNIMQPNTIKSKNNGCGTTPGNLVAVLLLNNSWMSVI